MRSMSAPASIAAIKGTLNARKKKAAYMLKALLRIGEGKPLDASHVSVGL